MTKIFIVLALVLFVIGTYLAFIGNYRNVSLTEIVEEGGGEVSREALHPLMVEYMRRGEYPGSEITVEQNLDPGFNYKRYIASYKSEGLKIFGLLTVPNIDPPAGGHPAIIFNHGYIPPEEYRTTERYVAYLDGFARGGYIVFKPDYRGHGNSEGMPMGAYWSSSYTIDVLNAISSIKKYSGVNINKIGMWGHSLGGHLALRVMVTTNDIKAGVIWAGVVGSHVDMVKNWRSRQPWSPSQREQDSRRTNRQRFIDEYGQPEVNPEFWRKISPISFVSEISGPVQIHHGLSDETVPWQFSESLKNALQNAERVVEYFTYEGADHNLSGSAFGVAMKRSVEFFDKYLK